MSSSIQSIEQQVDCAEETINSKQLDANSFLNSLGLILANPENKKEDYFQKQKTKIFYSPQTDIRPLQIKTKNDNISASLRNSNQNLVDRRQNFAKMFKDKLQMNFSRLNEN